MAEERKKLAEADDKKRKTPPQAEKPDWAEIEQKANVGQFVSPDQAGPVNVNIDDTVSLNEENVVAADKAGDPSVLPEELPGENKSAQPAEATPAQEPSTDTPRELLFRVGEIDVYVSLTDRQRFLAVDGLVIPVGVQGGLAGGFAQSLKRAVEPDIWNSLEAEIKGATSHGISPNTPVLVELNDPNIVKALLPNASNAADADGYYLIAATAGGVDDVEELSAAASSIVRLASEARIRRLAVLPLGTGRGQLRDQARSVGGQMARGIRIALGQVTGGTLQEVILATRDEAVAIGAWEVAQSFERNVAQPVLGDEPAWIDTLGIGPVADALAETLLLRQVKPPVTVGVFGSWGSGKTTFMRLMHQRMADIRALHVAKGWPDDSGEGELPHYAGHIYQIWFNAWTYAKSNLWASLMQQIFFELNRQLSAEDYLRQAGYDPLAGGRVYPDTLYAGEQVRDANLLWETLRRRNQQELEALQDTEFEIQQVAADRDQAETQQQVRLQAELEQEPIAVPADLLKSRATALAGDAATETLTQALNQTPETVDADQVEQVLNQLRSLGVTARKIGQAIAKRRWATVIYGLIALLIFTGIFLVTRFLELAEVQRWIAMLVSLIAVLIPPLSAALRVAQRWLDEVSQADDEFEDWAESQRQKLLDDKIRQENAQQTADVHEALDETGLDAGARARKLMELAGQGNLVAYNYWLEELEAKAARQRSQIGPPADYASLPEFIRERLDSKLYTNKLGFMNQVERDIKKLSDSLTFWSGDDAQAVSLKRELFPRGSPRVVLYIDDLDRCPPKRVVEVLEAVQLLLNRGLFIVVLALDTRYATRALEKQYRDILQRDGDPSGLDYVEKIIGIPYRVQPVNAEGLDNYLRLQMEIQDDDSATAGDVPARPQTGTSGNGEFEPDLPARLSPTVFEELPPQVVRFLPDDKTDLQVCLQQINLTPRSIKRLINVFKLLKIYWFRTLQTDPPRTAKRTMIGLLALSAGYPEIMREAFVHLEQTYGKPELFESNTVGESLADFAGTGAGELVPVGLLDRFQSDLDILIQGTDRPSPELQRFFDIKLNEFGKSLLDTVRSFSYVGDPSYVIFDQERDGVSKGQG